MPGEKLRIATSSYHIGHAIAPMIASERGFFKEEGFINFELLLEGLIPSFVEKIALSACMKNRGVQVVLGAQIPSVLALNSVGEDLHIVSGWRFVPQTDWYARPGIKSFADMKGKRIGIRDGGGTGPVRLIWNGLRDAGLDPEKHVTWVKDRIFAYHRTPEHVEAMREGRVDCTASSPPFSQELEKIGCTLLLSPRKLFPRGKPMSVIAARKSVIKERGQDLQALLRAILRAFWLVRDQPDNYSYVADLEKRLRSTSHSEDERALRMFTSPESLETMPMPLDGQVPMEGLKQIGEEMKRNSELPAGFPVENALMDSSVKEAFRDLRSRKELASQWERANRVMKKWGC